MSKKLYILLSFIANLSAYKIDNYVSTIDKNNLEVKTEFELDQKEILYKDSFSVTSNNPGVIISEPKTKSSAASFFDTTFQQNKLGFKNKVEYTYTVTKTDAFNTSINPVLDFTYYINTNNSSKSDRLDISEYFMPKQTNSVKYQEQETAPKPGVLASILDFISAAVAKIKSGLSNLFSSSGSKTIKLLAALLLGVLLSLTPCLYPMIPITIGILQANKVQTGFQSFLMALSYTIGVSLTFAILGLVASASSLIFGELQGSPYFIIPLVILLAYLGLSMFGFYEMYIPRFLQSSNDVKGGSYGSAFLFGAVSGTVASPCLSPGLALILNYVTSISHTGSLASYIEGFFLLFIFGIGSSLPLLIIGTFSSAVNVLPRAGLWMVEVKKLVGLMLIFMCFYNLSSLSAYISTPILLALLSLVLIFFGAYYFWSVEKFDSAGLVAYKNIVGFLLIATAVFAGYSAVKSKYMPTEDKFWLHDYESSLDLAKQNSKNLFLDIGATYCGACKELDHNIFQRSDVRAAISDKFVPVKIESDQDVEVFSNLKSKYGKYIAGFPTYLVIDSKSGEVIKNWGSELEDLAIQDFIKQLK